MDPKKFHTSITVLCLFIGILAYNMWMPNDDFFRNHCNHYMDKWHYQMFAFLVGGFFGGLSYIGLYSLVCAFLEKDKEC